MQNHICYRSPKICQLLLTCWLHDRSFCLLTRGTYVGREIKRSYLINCWRSLGKKIPTCEQVDKSGRWYLGGGNARCATSNGDVKRGALRRLIGAPSLEVHFWSSTFSCDKFRIFLMENKFSLAENEEMPGVDDAIPLVAIMVLV